MRPCRRFFVTEYNGTRGNYLASALAHCSYRSAWKCAAVHSTCGCGRDYSTYTFDLVIGFTFTLMGGQKTKIYHFPYITKFWTPLLRPWLIYNARVKGNKLISSALSIPSARGRTTDQYRKEHFRSYILDIARKVKQR